MGNEMGNNNVSGLQEEEKTRSQHAAETLSEDVVRADDVMKGENHTKTEVEGKDFREKQSLDEKENIGGDDMDDKNCHEVMFSSGNPMGAGDSHVEKETFVENEQNDTELKTPQSVEIPVEAKDAASHGSRVQIFGSSDNECDEDAENYKKQILDGSSIGTNEDYIQKQMPVIEENTESSNSNSRSESHEVDPRCGQHEMVHAVQVADGSTISSEELVASSSSQAENGDLVRNEMTEKMDISVVSDNDEQTTAETMDSLFVESQASEEESLLDRTTFEGTYAVSCPEEVENSMRNECNRESPLEASKSLPGASESPVEASELLMESSESQMEAFSEINSMNYSEEVSEEESKSAGLVIELIKSEKEKGENKFGSCQTSSSRERETNFESNECNVSQSIEFDCRKNEKGSEISSGIEESSRVEECKAISNDAQVGCVHQILEPSFKEKPKMENSMLLTEEIKSVSESESGENKCDRNQTEYYDKAVKDFKTDNFDSSQLAELSIESDFNTSEEKDTAVEFYSSSNIGENCQFEEFDYKNDEDRAKEDVRDKGLDSHSLPYSTTQPQDFPQQVLDSEAAEQNRNEPIVESKQQSCSEFFIINEGFNMNPSDEITKRMLAAPDTVLSRNVQTTSEMIAETETPSVLYDEQSAKAQESVEKLFTESSSGDKSTHIEFRKSPSFHFDLSIEARSEESDQTPLLCLDKTAARSLSSRGDARYEEVSVEEKTIRMERSDSEKPSTPFLSFLKNKENAEVLATEKQESNAADKKPMKNSWTVVHKAYALTSQRGNAGKRKPKSSIFTNCICCGTPNS